MDPDGPCCEQLFSVHNNMTMDTDNLAVNTIRCLSADMVSKAKSGHPGAPIGCAPIAHVLFSDLMKFYAPVPKWMGRDYFVLSNGHASALMYSMLHLAGFKLPMSELENFRQFGSKTPGHPERGVTPGVEVTTGPLGQGVSNAVGIAVAAKVMGHKYNKPNFPLFDNHVYSIVGDGCLMEGVSAEALSLAGTLNLDNLTVIWDDNKITIDGATDQAFAEDTIARFKAYGFETFVVEEGDTDIVGLRETLAKAKACPKPSFVAVRTTIGYKSAKEGTAAVHGSPLNAEHLAELKGALGMPADKFFHVPESVEAHYKGKGVAREAAFEEWSQMVEAYLATYPENANVVKRIISGEREVEADAEALIATLMEKDLKDSFPVGKGLSTRKASGEVLSALYNELPWMMGGSADLSGSNCTRIAGAGVFGKDNRDSRYIPFGVREHAMCAISNGIAAYSTALVPFDATFLVFLGYCVGALRVGALSRQRSIHVFTHDSIGLGEDGPTHMPIETMTYIRSTPNMADWRPADGDETIGAYAWSVCCSEGPSVMALSRQNVPHLAGSTPAKAMRGGYVVVQETTEAPKVVLISTGTEVSLTIEAAKAVEAAYGVEGCVRVVSMPSMVVYKRQSAEYRASVVPAGVPVVSVEPHHSMSWAGLSHFHIGLDRFGESAPIKALYEHFGFTPEAICAKVQKVVAQLEGNVPALGFVQVE
ncbi:transketolase, bacterial-like [Kipferlia bialata]|uniref:transketolase n=1 Tax=Kipferlia bialata TaxID=797122 RepID=A0A9K3CUC1_9EUKA|nr:transketolase, bacterial-like [Kipferlia bialata]|eukprot:g4797.t1